jgi:hypothetical protein
MAFLFYLRSAKRPTDLELTPGFTKIAGSYFGAKLAKGERSP